MVSQLHLDLNHEPLIGLPPLRFLLLILKLHDFGAYYVFNKFLLLLVI